MPYMVNILFDDARYIVFRPETNIEGKWVIHPIREKKMFEGVFNSFEEVQKYFVSKISASSSDYYALLRSA